MKVSTILNTLIGATATLPALTSAISLSNFTPRLTDLPRQCNNAYNSQISGCQTTDFGKGAECSQACISGLVSIQTLISSACKGVEVDAKSIVGVFLSGQGLPALCPGVAVTTVQSSEKAAPTTSARRTQAKETSTDDSQDSPTTSTSSSGSSPTEKSASSSAQITTTMTTPSVTPVSTVSQSSVVFVTKTSSTKPTPTSKGQKSNQDSGGGSPFDVQISTGGSSRTRSNKPAIVVGGLMALGGAWILL